MLGRPSSLKVGPNDFSRSDVYLQILPEYVFGGVAEKELVASRVCRLIPDVHTSVLVDCGAGPGRIWDSLPMTLRILAVEPDPNMWASEVPMNVEYIRADGLEFLLKSRLHFDVITWLWSLNYALSGFFEQLDLDRGRIERFAWNHADACARAALLCVFRRRSDGSIFVAFFDSDSAEQQFVTDVWSHIAPFPYNNRGHTRKIVEWAFEIMSNEGMNCDVEHLRGTVSFGSPTEARDRIMGFHFRNFPPIERAAGDLVDEFCRSHITGDAVVCEAGVYLYTATPADAIS